MAARDLGAARPAAHTLKSVARLVGADEAGLGYTDGGQAGQHAQVAGDTEPARVGASLPVHQTRKPPFADIRNHGDGRNYHSVGRTQPLDLIRSNTRVGEARRNHYVKAGAVGEVLGQFPQQTVLLGVQFHGDSARISRQLDTQGIVSAFESNQFEGCD